MEIDEAISKRRTIQNFSKKKVASEIIDKAISAANKAPCHKLTFPWRYRNINKETRLKYALIVIEKKTTGQNTSEKMMNKIKSKLLDPSDLIVVTQIKSSSVIRQKEDYAACCCSIQNLSLSLTGQGVGMKWSTGELTTIDSTYILLNINKDIEDIIGFLWIGYGECPSEIHRPKLNDIYFKQ